MILAEAQCYACDGPLEIRLTEEQEATPRGLVRWYVVECLRCREWESGSFAPPMGDPRTDAEARKQLTARLRRQQMRPLAWREAAD